VSCYANAILDYIDPHNEWITHRLFRENCIETEHGYIKDLRIFLNRLPKDLIIVDNSTISFVYQIGNGVPILPYYDNKKDMEL